MIWQVLNIKEMGRLPAGKFAFADSQYLFNRMSTLHLTSKTSLKAGKRDGHVGLA